MPSWIPAFAGMRNEKYRSLKLSAYAALLRPVSSLCNTPYLVPERKLLIFPISASGLNFNPQNTQCIPVVKICAFPELEKIF